MAETTENGQNMEMTAAANHQRTASIGTNTESLFGRFRRSFRHSVGSISTFYDFQSVLEDDPDLRRGRPAKTQFKQQQLPAWEPILTPHVVIPLLLITGVLMIAIGGFLLFVSLSLTEIHLSYEDHNCTEIGANCSFEFTIDSLIKKPVFIYYELYNFYQNHRRYAQSVDWDQFDGHPNQINKRKGCYENNHPATLAFNDTSKQFPYAPCGYIANSLFSDTIQLETLVENNWTSVPVTDKDLGPPDYRKMYKNPKNVHDFNRTAKPPLWKCPVNKIPGNMANEDLQVWMNVAAFSRFRKLYRRVNHEQKNLTDGLPPGTYRIYVENWFNVSAFHGKKAVVIANANWFGGKNKFLGIIYIVVGILSAITGGVLWITHVKYGRKAYQLVSIRRTTPYR